MGNGYITRKPKPKTTEVLVFADTTPDDTGKVRLKIDVVNAGNAPRIYYEEDGIVTENSPLFSDDSITTKALRVQFFAVDPTGKNQTGNPKIWENSLTLRSNLNESSRTVELFVAPRGSIRYTLDGSEARNGTEYRAPIEIGDEAATIYVFAGCDGLEVKRTFQFAECGSKDITIIREKPVQFYSTSPKRLNNSAKTYEGIKIAKEKNITFEQVTLMIGSAPKVIHLSIGEVKIDGDLLEKELSHLQTLVPPEASVIMMFKKAYMSTGFDLEQFAKALNIEINAGEVIQE